jgi:hypothetical protein
VEREKGVEVATIEGSMEAAEKLHVLLPHRLLPQPGGFEGVFGIEVGPHPNRFAVLGLDQEGEWRLGLGATLLATRADAADPENAVAEVPNLRELDVDFDESRVQVSPQLADALASPIHRRFASYQRRHPRMPLHLGVDFLEQRFYVSAVGRLNGAPKGLDVLL